MKFVWEAVPDKFCSHGQTIEAGLKMLSKAQLSWLERRTSDRKFAGSMPILGITSLCPWERHLMLIS